MRILRDRICARTPFSKYFPSVQGYVEPSYLSFSPFKFIFSWDWREIEISPTTSFDYSKSLENFQALPRFRYVHAAER